jgi:hypothetical protein
MRTTDPDIFVPLGKPWTRCRARFHNERKGLCVLSVEPFPALTFQRMIRQIYISPKLKKEKGSTKKKNWSTLTHCPCLFWANASYVRRERLLPYVEV